MKRIILALAALLSVTLGANAQEYCMTKPIGYGASATGGQGYSVTLITSLSGLQTALKNGKGIYIITQNITITANISSSASNFTLMALPGVTITCEGQYSGTTASMYLKGSNIILRNLTFIGMQAYDCDASDNLCLDGATNVWVDHCDFQDGADDCFDMKGNTDNVTVSWCRMRHLKGYKSGGSGGTDDHRFVNLIGSSSSAAPTDGTYNITFMDCWWDNGNRERMVRCRHAYLHFLNCYWSSDVSNYYIGPENSSVYIEGCYFAKGGFGTTNAKVVYTNYGGTNYASFVNSYSEIGFPSKTACTSTPSYSYTAETYTNAKTYVTNTTCGAGATLTVTTTGEVSSSCDAAEPTITLSSAEATAEQNLQEGTAMTDIAYTYGGTANKFEIVYKANGSTVSKPSWLTATTSGSKVTFTGTPTAISSSNTTYTITINSTDGSTDSDPLTATIAVTPLTPGTLVLTSGSAAQSIYTNQAVSTIVYTYGGGATGATVTGLPTGVSYTTDASGKITISGTATVAGTYSYTVTTTGGSTQKSLTGTITVSDPTTLATPSATYTTSGSTATVTWAAVENASSYNVQVCSSNGSSGTTTATWDMADIYTASSGSIAATTTYSGLTVTPKDGTAITVESSSKTFSDGFAGTYRLKTGGSSATEGNTPTNRFVSFTVDGPSKITVWWISGSSSAERSVIVSDGTNEIGSMTSSEASILEADYSGTGGTIYVYCDASINIYKVAVEPKAATSCNTYNTTSTTYDATISGTTTISVQAVGDGVAYNSSEYAEAVEASVPVAATITLTSSSANATTLPYSAITNIVYTYTGQATLTWTGTASSTTAPAGITVTNSEGKITISGTPTASGTYGYSISVDAINGGTPATASATGTITVNELPAPVLSTSSVTTQDVTIGDAISSIVYTSDIEANWTINGLPDGVDYEVAADNKSVTISGTPSTISTSNFTVKAANPLDATKYDTETGTITVSDAPAVCGKMVTFKLTVTTAGSYTLKIFNGSTEIKSLYTGTFSAGTSTLFTAVSDVDAGTYTYKLVDGSGNVVNSQTGDVTIP